VQEEIERKVEDVINHNEEAQNDDEFKDLLSKQVRLQEQGHCFLEKEDWKKQLKNIHELTVLKMPKIIQCLMYLLGFKREQICEPKTNKLFWKIAKQFICTEVPNRM
jgi:hypothetical protein